MASVAEAMEERGPAVSDSAAAGGHRRREPADLLRLITCGSVDDGKSTLIGRLLHDTKSIHQDQWEAVHRTSLRRGDERVDLALLTDGLRAEREQGITIDVAYRYFSTPNRKYILADTPGHVQYTRNMATGASTAELALILIDARQGVLEQTRRHAYIAALLGVHQLVVCINKMDLVDWDERVHRRISEDVLRFVRGEGGTQGRSPFAGAELTLFPMSALHGDNVVHPSPHTPWFTGGTLLEHLERVPVRPPADAFPARFPVQWVLRPQSDEHHDYRGYGGRMAAGRLAVGDEVIALPGGQRSRVARIHLLEELAEIRHPLSATLTLEHDLDLARGDMLVPADSPDADRPQVTRELEATVLWMSEQPLTPSRRYLIKHGARSVRAMIGPISRRLNLLTLAMDAPDSGNSWPELRLNELGEASLRLAAPLVVDPYFRCRETGAFIVIDEGTNNTVGAGMIRSARVGAGA
jgi:sulfate adenylyltransferase large subunit